ncbi:uncharacterized protein H6S33_011685, partial [Morchella sextelata]|uniref:uncharacterized protein n=1 Tax=Morchella sextelata TaxID=1174677 RepID=UPI001D03A451
MHTYKNGYHDNNSVEIDSESCARKRRFNRISSHYKVSKAFELCTGDKKSGFR